MLPRFQHILVPVDLTPKNRAALDIAFELAAENKARVSLLHVTQTIDPSGQVPDDDTRQFYDRIQQRVLTELESLSQRFSAANLSVEIKIHLGQPLRDIVVFSESHNVDLIIMSSHPVDKDDFVRSWGTLSYKVSVACQCPILLVK
jgi:nucleotide-binding universal stress UspA family protein